MSVSECCSDSLPSDRLLQAASKSEWPSAKQKEQALIDPYSSPETAYYASVHSLWIFLWSGVNPWPKLGYESGCALYEAEYNQGED